MEVKIDGWRCERCEHIWPKTKDLKPRVCAKCHSPYWDRPRKKKYVMLVVNGQPVEQKE
jgi:uncharacterized C2H2 Zn-finger protein